MFVARNLLTALATVIDYALWAYMWAFIIRAVLSWVSPDPYNPIVRALYSVTEPVLSFLRRKLPLFAGSIGRGNQSWALARQKVREQILTLPADTLICPGHGPLTTE